MKPPLESPRFDLPWLRAWRARKRVRPTPPTVGRQVATVGAALVAIVALHLFSATVVPIPNLGLPFFLLTIAVSLWGGVWPGLASCALLVLYVWIVQTYRLHPYELGSVYYSSTTPRNLGRELRAPPSRSPSGRS